MVNYEALKYALALRQIKGIGDIVFKRLAPTPEHAEVLFKMAQKKRLQKGVSEKLRTALLDFNDWSSIESTIQVCIDHGIQIISHNDEQYPDLLKHCDNGPSILFAKGRLNNDYIKTIAIVGTRQSTEYGRRFVEALMEALAAFNVAIISGLAFGTDLNAHKAALRNGLDTYAVLGQGLCHAHPHYKLDVIHQMATQGGLLSDYLCFEPPKKEHFPERNRIVAGMSHVVLVIESGSSGGSLITAKWANEFNRDVFALPGKANDPFSKGCNQLIRLNKAGIITGIQELLFDIGLVNHQANSVAQVFLNATDLNPKAQVIINVLKKGPTHIDIIHYTTNLPMQELSFELLQLEFNGVIKLQAGMVYSLMV